MSVGRLWSISKNLNDRMRSLQRVLQDCYSFHPRKILYKVSGMLDGYTSRVVLAYGYMPASLDNVSQVNSFGHIPL